MHRYNKSIALIILVLGIMMIVTGCQGIARQKESGQNHHYYSIGKVTGKTASAAQFASYQETAVTVNPAVEPYRAAADLGNITNRDRFEFSPAAQKLIVQNGFVVVPSVIPEFFMVYEPNRYDGLPNFITTDSMLHNYHIFFNYLLKEVEEKSLIPELKDLNKSMLSEASQQYTLLQGTSWEKAARRNLAFFTVGSCLLDSQVKIPSPVAGEVKKELSLIEAHKGIDVSPLMNTGIKVDAKEKNLEDYSQYIPRGHYTKSIALKRYFQSMMWYGRMSFRVQDADETRSAVLITLALSKGDNLKTWNNIYETTRFFVGESDDPGYYEYMPLLQKIYGGKIELAQLPADETKWNSFIKQARKLKPPSINSIPVFNEEIQPDREPAITAFRFMGQRFTLDASIFQRLVYREVTANPQGARRMLPKGLDIPAAMGSDTAYAILGGMGETKYGNYPNNMVKLQDYISGLKHNTWTQNLYWAWLYSLQPLTEEKLEGYPSFMTNQAWSRKELATYLGSWTELKHDTILYAKQCYAEMGGGIGETDDRGYVEPNPAVYARLAALAGVTRDGLAARGLLEARDKTSLGRMQELSLALQKISEKELNNIPLSAADYELIRTFGGQLEHFWMEALRDEVQGRPDLWDNPSALVTDVATDPNGTVLEEGTGYISKIYAVVPVEGKLRIAVGGVYSYYEFTQPIDQRLTDQQWWQILKDKKTPPAPAWTSLFATDPGDQVRVILPDEQ